MILYLFVDMVGQERVLRCDISLMEESRGELVFVVASHPTRKYKLQATKIPKTKRVLHRLASTSYLLKYHARSSFFYAVVDEYKCG